MRIPESYRTCTVFLGQVDGDDFVARGTAFLIAHTIGDDGGGGLPYLVTARHVTDKSRSEGEDLFVKVNGPGGDADIVGPLEPDDWWMSATSDVALRFFPEAPGFDLTPVWDWQFATAVFVESEGLGPGDEVFFSGLFTSHPGSDHVEPVVRFGNISMKPREPVRIRNADESVKLIEAWLVEARSWGGQSGSPAFVYLPPDRQPGKLVVPSGPSHDAAVLASLPRLLGMVVGHFSLHDDTAFINDAAALGFDSLNTGIAIVVPAQALIDALEDDEFQDRRNVVLGAPPPPAADD